MGSAPAETRSSPDGEGIASDQSFIIHCLEAGSSELGGVLGHHAGQPPHF